jgi:hypothetical protein
VADQIDIRTMSNADQTTYFGSVKVYPAVQEETLSNMSWTGDTVVSSSSQGEEQHDMADLPRRILSDEETGSITSVMTDYYLDQIKDSEERESARRNIDYLRELGFHVHGKLVDGKYYVKFFTPTQKVEVMSVKSFIKAKIRNLVQH